MADVDVSGRELLPVDAALIAVLNADDDGVMVPVRSRPGIVVSSDDDADKPGITDSI